MHYHLAEEELTNAQTEKLIEKNITQGKLMEELTLKLEAKYGLIMTRKEVMDALKVSISTVRRFEDKGQLLRIPHQGKIIRFSCETVAKLMVGGSCESHEIQGAEIL